MRRALLAIALLVVVGFGACQLFLPQRFAVNAPIRGIFFGATPPPRSELEKRMKLPAGFGFGVYAEGIPNARFLRFTTAGDLLVSSPREKAVFILARDANGDGRADSVKKLVTGLDAPHGLEFVGDWLYIAETGAVKRVRFDAAKGAVTGQVETVLAGLPTGGNHWTKTIRLGPDGWMYVSMGSTCNVCLETEPRRATIARFKPDGSGYETYATGLRNSVGFDWRPADGALYATDNGRDLLGDDIPPCELNEIQPGKFYGWPYRYGHNVPDPDFGTQGGDQAASAVPPAHEFGAHVAPLGMRFYRGTAFPERYRGQAFVALHGSWNRSKKSGYKVVLLEWKPDGSIAESDFLTGFELNEDVVGRPVDVLDGPDGALYVSDDFAGAVYRVQYRGAE
ncbi:MAG TPA: sorbosone dehydrogenase family protein [Myxococcota bacterium]|nr:sorbosone dehydrogenase family protein [Myxococcota bacterium]